MMHDGLGKYSQNTGYSTPTPQRSPAVPRPILKNLLVCNVAFARVALRGDTYNTPSQTGKKKGTKSLRT